MRTRSRPSIGLAVVALLALTGAGCSSGADTGTSGSSLSTSVAAGPSSTTATKELTASEKAVKFAECMRQNGVGDFPDPTDKNADAYGVSVTPAVFTKAVDACKALKPPGALSSKYTPQQLSAAVMFARCVRDKGVRDFPDPADGQPLIDTTKIPSSNRAGGMTILNAATARCAGLLRKAMRRRG